DGGQSGQGSHQEADGEHFVQKGTFFGLRGLHLGFFLVGPSKKENGRGITAVFDGDLLIRCPKTTLSTSDPRLWHWRRPPCWRCSGFARLCDRCRAPACPPRSRQGLPSFSTIHLSS